MAQIVLQVLLDPRVWLGGGFLFFGGIVVFAELSQRFQQKRKPASQKADELEDR